MLFVALIAAAPHPMLVPAFGFGSVKCEAAFKSGAEMQSENWILGFWTGLNVQSGRSVGAGRSNDDVRNGVRKVCAQNPSVTLLSATQTAYKAMKGR